MLGQRFEGNGRKRCLVCCLENNRSGYPVVVRLQPPTCTDSPSITWLEPGESELGVRRRKIVPDGLLVLEELGGHHRTHRVGPDVVGTGVGETVPVEAGPDAGVGDIGAGARRSSCPGGPGATMLGRVGPAGVWRES